MIRWRPAHLGIWILFTWLESKINGVPVQDVIRAQKSYGKSCVLTLVWLMSPLADNSQTKRNLPGTLRATDGPPPTRRVSNEDHFMLLPTLANNFLNPSFNSHGRAHDLAT